MFLFLVFTDWSVLNKTKTDNFFFFFCLSFCFLKWHTVAESYSLHLGNSNWILCSVFFLIIRISGETTAMAVKKKKKKGIWKSMEVGKEGCCKRGEIQSGQLLQFYGCVSFVEVPEEKKKNCSLCKLFSSAFSSVFNKIFFFFFFQFYNIETKICLRNWILWNLKNQCSVTNTAVEK